MIDRTRATDETFWQFVCVAKAEYLTNILSVTRWFLAVFLGLTLSLLTNAKELEPTPLPIEALFAFPDIGKVKISPDTKLLAATVRVGERMHLVVIDLESRKLQPVMAFSDADIGWFTWISNRRLVFNGWDQTVAGGDQPGNGLFAVNADGSEFKELMPTFRKQIESAAGLRTVYGAEYLSRVAGTEDILYISRQSDKRSILVKRQNSHTGRDSSMVIGIKGEITRAMTDSKGELRALISIDVEGQMLVWYRADGQSTWKNIATFEKTTSPDAWIPVGVSDDGRTLWVNGRRDRDKEAIYAFDIARNKLEGLAFSHPTADIEGGLKFDPENGKLLGITIEAEKVEHNWFDPDWGSAQATIDAALPGKLNSLSGDAKTRLLVRSYSDIDPGHYYLFDVKARRLSEQLDARPMLNRTQLAATKVIHYQARDQLPILAYLTLPKGDRDKALPLVVLVHGGPYLRDSWEFDAEVQFLASRGYAVLQPQFRGSTGFGSKHFRAGWRTWGLAMQDDLSDGVRSLIEAGTVDSHRVCIMGASYGGYAALMGVVRDPDLYKCAISLAGVADIRLMFSIGWSDIAGSLWADFGMTDMIGDPKLLGQQFVATSPIEQVAKIKAAVLLAHGTDDYRVPITHAEKMRDALRGAGKQVEWHVYPGEAHGLTKSANRYAYYRSIEVFLQKHLQKTVD